MKLVSQTNVTVGQQRRFGALLVLFVSLLVGACASPAETPAPPTLPPATPTIFRIVITRTPAPTLTLEPTATLPYDINAAAGTWALDLRFTLRDNPAFSNVQYIGTAGLNVDTRGSVSGAVEFYVNVTPSVAQVGCTAASRDSAPITARVSGQLRPGDDGATLADLRLTPDDPLATTSLWLFCPDFVAAEERTEPLFWPAVQSAGQLDLTLPLVSGGRAAYTADLSGPGSGGLYGLLLTDLRLTRTG